jgi:hypothetical protein
MAILDSNQMLFTPFEPKVANRFYFTVDGIPSFMIKGMSAITVEQGEIKLNHINVYRKIKGRANWSDLTLTLFDPITPSGAQAVMEWVRLHHESVTGRDGYSDFYKKDLTLDILGPVGDIVSEWVLKGCIITNANFGEYSWDNESAAQNLTMTVQPDYCVLNF